MAHWDDALGDELKAIEATESSRAAARGEVVVIRVDGASFSRFTSVMEKPFDVRMSRAMVEATRTVVEDFKCRIGYTQSDEATFLLWEPEGELPFGGRLQKIASRFASKFGSAFLMQAIRLFPDAVERQVPEFDGRANGFPSLDYAARNVLWREVDARKNAVSMAARARFPHSMLQGRSSQEMKAMLAGDGYEFYEQPEAFRRGTFLRRVVEDRFLTPEELERIPPAHRPKGTVRRSRVAEIPMPPLSLVENLADVLLRGDEPVVRPREGFVAAIVP